MREVSRSHKAWGPEVVHKVTYVGGYTVAEAVAKFDEIGPGDPETAHSDADEILLAVAAPEVRDAYRRCVERVGSWWFS